MSWFDRKPGERDDFSRDIIDTVIWIRLKLPKGQMLPAQITVAPELHREIISRPGHPVFVQSSVANYPVDCNLYKVNELQVPIEGFIQRIFWMFDESTAATDRDRLKANYMYRFYIDHKWYSEGPLRMFPLVANLTQELTEHANLSLPEPWCDVLEIPRVLYSGAPFNLNLTGVPFVPTGDIDVMAGLGGKLARMVQ